MSAKASQHRGPILSARGIVNRFGKQEVHDGISLDVRPGEVLGIAGGSGSGKSVLLKTLIGLHRPNAGEVLLNGKSIETLDPAEKASLIGVLFQQGALFSSLSVAQNIMLPMREHTDLPPEEQQRLVSLKLALAGLSAETGVKFPSELSGGMVKRAAFARAIRAGSEDSVSRRAHFRPRPADRERHRRADSSTQSEPRLDHHYRDARSRDAVYGLRPCCRTGRRENHHRHRRRADAFEAAMDSRISPRAAGTRRIDSKEAKPWKRISIISSRGCSSSG